MMPLGGPIVLEHLGGAQTLELAVGENRAAFRGVHTHSDLEPLHMCRSSEAEDWIAMTDLVPSGPRASLCTVLAGAGQPVLKPACLSPNQPVPSYGTGVVGVCLGGYLIETTGSWTSVFNLVAAISSLGLCTFLVFGKAQRVDLSPAHEDL